MVVGEGVLPLLLCMVSCVGDKDGGIGEGEVVRVVVGAESPRMERVEGEEEDQGLCL